MVPSSQSLSSSSLRTAVNWFRKLLISRDCGVHWVVSETSKKKDQSLKISPIWNSMIEYLSSFYLVVLVQWWSSSFEKRTEILWLDELYIQFLFHLIHGEKKWIFSSKNRNCFNSWQRKRLNIQSLESNFLFLKFFFF